MKYILPFLLLFYPMYGDAQKCVVTSRTGNIVFFDFPNAVDIAGNGQPCNNITLTTSNGVIEKNIYVEDPCAWIFTPATIGNAVIFVKLKNKVTDSFRFHAQPLPAPSVQVGGQSGGNGQLAFVKTCLARGSHQRF